MVAVGRKAYTAGLGLEKVGIEVNERGQVSVNDHLQTNINSIYAICDVHDVAEVGTLVGALET